jgi:hypothetical protein
MTFITCLLLTIANVAICLTLPKLLSVIMTAKTKQSELTPSLNSPAVESKIPSFPY